MPSLGRVEHEVRVLDGEWTRFAGQQMALVVGVDDQVTEGDRVASRWVLNDTYHGRPVVLRGIMISRFGDDGRILEDHAHSDTISLARQLAVPRTLVLGLEVLTRRAKLPKGALRRTSP